MLRQAINFKCVRKLKYYQHEMPHPFVTYLVNHHDGSRTLVVTLYKQKFTHTHAHHTYSYMYSTVYDTYKHIYINTIYSGIVRAMLAVAVQLVGIFAMISLGYLNLCHRRPLHKHTYINILQIIIINLHI